MGSEMCIRDSDRGDGLPAVPAGVLEPHRRALIFGTAGVTHGVDIHRQRVTESVLHIARRQIDEKCRQRVLVLSRPSSVKRCRPHHYWLGEVSERHRLTSTAPVIESSGELGGTAQIDLVS